MRLFFSAKGVPVRAVPLLSISPPVPAAVMGSEPAGGVVVVPVERVVPLAAWFRPPSVPASMAAVRLVVRVAADVPAGPP